MQVLDNKGGWVLYGAAVLIMVVAGLGVTLMYLSMGSISSNENQWISSKANYIAQAGAEYAMREYYNGNASAVVVSPGRSFSGGYFTIAESGTPPNITVAVTGQFSNSTRTIRFNKPSQASCLEWDNSGTALVSANTRIQQLMLSKICLDQIVVDRMILTWNTPTQLIIDFQFDGISQSIAPPKSSGEQMDIVNYVMSNGLQREIRIDFNSSVSGKTFNLSMIMSDGSVSDVSFGPY